MAQDRFRRHYISEALLLNWEKIKKQHYLKIPVWLSTIEAFSYSIIFRREQIVRYSELLNEKGELKAKQELEEQGLKMNWVSYIQIHSRYDEDCNTEGFYNNLTNLDKILTGPDDYVIKKIVWLKLEEE